MTHEAKAREFLLKHVLGQSVNDRMESALAALLEETAGGARAEAGFAVLPERIAGVDHAVCLEGRWQGWLFRRHRDGQWVSVRKLQVEEPPR